MNEHPMKTYRDAHSMTLEVLAARAGSTPATLSRIEQRKQLPSMTLVARLKAETGLSADDFLPLTHDATSEDVTHSANVNT